MHEVSFTSSVALMYRFANYLAIALRFVAALCIAAMATVTMAEIVLRYFFSTPLPWANELARTLFLWSVMLGIAVATWFKGHIAVTLLEISGPVSLRSAVRIVAIICVLILSLILAIQGQLFASTNLSNTTPALQISLAVATSSVSAGGIFMSIFSVLILFEELVPTVGEIASAVRSGHVSQ